MKRLLVSFVGALLAGVPFWIEYGFKPWPSWWIGIWVGFLGAGCALYWHREFTR